MVYRTVKLDKGHHPQFYGDCVYCVGKMFIKLLRSAFLGTDRITAKVRSYIHTKKVSIKLPRSAVVWSLPIKAVCGSEPQVLWLEDCLNDMYDSLHAQSRDNKLQ